MKTRELKFIQKIINERLIESAKRLYPIPHAYIITAEDRLLNKPKEYFITRYRPFYQDYSNMSDELVIGFLSAAIQGSCNVVALADTWDTEKGQTLIITSNNSMSRFTILQ